MDKIRFGTQLLASKVMGRNVPFQVNIHINDVCNLRCRYCYIDFDNASKDFPLPELKKVLTDCAEMGTQRISLEGGEPLLRKDIVEIVSFIQEKGMECNVNSNGYVFPKLANQLKNLDMLSISLDGKPEVHDQLRGKGSFEKALAAIETARSLGIKVHILSVMTKINRGSIDFMIDLARRTGSQFVPNTTFFCADDSKRDPEREKEYLMDDEDYRAMLREVLAKKEAGAPIVWSRETLDYVARWPLTYSKSNMWKDEADRQKDWKPVPCMAGKFFCVIQTNGDVYTCDPMIGYGKTANCLELGFKEAFRRLNIGNCSACTSLVLNEYHHLFNLNPSVIMNLALNYGRAT